MMPAAVETPNRILGNGCRGSAKLTLRAPPPAGFPVPMERASILKQFSTFVLSLR
jgi:hypothetical protein